MKLWFAMVLAAVFLVGCPCDLTPEQEAQRAEACQRAVGTSQWVMRPCGHGARCFHCADEKGLTIPVYDPVNGR